MTPSDSGTRGQSNLDVVFIYGSDCSIDWGRRFGLTVYVGLGRLDIGQAFVGGIGIVLIAIIFDRISQKFI